MKHCTIAIYCAHVEMLNIAIDHYCHLIKAVAMSLYHITLSCMLAHSKSNNLWHF